MNSAEALLQVAVQAAATDIVLTPGTGAGNIHLRSGFRSVHSQPLPHKALWVLARQLYHLAGMPEESPLLQLQVGSFEHQRTRIRLTRMLTDGGPVVRLRLQSPGLLERALEEFRRGDYGGTDCLPFLEFSSGILVLSGPPSSGKTSALSHLLSCGTRRRLLVSEARELSAEVEAVNPVRRSASNLQEDLEKLDPPTVALDEMDEDVKLALAAGLGCRRLVLLTLTAPNLAAALRRVVAGGIEPEALLGVLRVTWAEDAEQVRRPLYRWYPVGRSEGGLCPVCGAPISQEGPCPTCGLEPLRRFVDRVILERMNSPEGYRALDRLEAEWGE